MTDPRVSTVSLSEDRWDTIQPGLARLSRRGEKLGTGAISVEVIERWAERRPRLIPTDHGLIPHPRARRTVRVTREIDVDHDAEVVVPMVTVSVRGARPILNGWALVAVLQHVTVEDGSRVTVIRGVPGLEIPTEYRSVEPRCDHCGLDRRRNDTYLVRHEESGEYRQVGSSCLSDFTGHKSPEEFLLVAGWLFRLAGLLDDGEAGWGEGSGSWATSLSNFFPAVVRAVREIGWVSRSKAREEPWEHPMATADLALKILGRGPSENLDLRVEAEDVEASDQMLEEVFDLLLPKDPDTLTSFEHNLRVVLLAGYVTDRLAGIAAAIYPVVRRERERREREAYRASLPPSEWVGQIGKRQTFDVRVEGIRITDGTYGPSTLYRLRTPEGALLVWWASGVEPLGTDGAEGNSLRVKATVKRHDTYREEKQTVVNRVAPVSTQQKVCL